MTEQPMAHTSSQLRFRLDRSYTPTALTNVGADIRQSQKEAGLVEERTKQKNHDPTGILQLLAVPWYADLLEDDAEVSANDEEPNPEPRSGLVKSRAGWWREIAKWVR